MSQLNCSVNSFSWSRYVQVDKLWLYTASVTDGIVTDACKGDSGGPLILENGAQPLLIGVLEVTEGRWNNVKAKIVKISDGQNKNLIIVSRGRVTTAAQTPRAGTEAGAMWFLRGTGFSVTSVAASQVPIFDIIFESTFPRMLFQDRSA